MTARPRARPAPRSVASAAACALAAVLVLGASAEAATVSLTSQAEEIYGAHGATRIRATVRIVDDRGADDALTVTLVPAGQPGAPARVRVSDPAGLALTEGCAPFDPSTAECLIPLGSDVVDVDALLGAGSDRFEVGPGFDVVDVEGGDGDDELLGPVAAAPLLRSTGLYLDGGPGRDVLRARAASSASFRSSPGADLLDTGSSRVDLSYASSSEGVRVDLRTGEGDGGNAEGDRILGALFALRGSPHGDRFRASAGGDDIAAGRGDDVVLGGPGNDALDAGGGDDLLAGGPGDDILTAGIGESSARDRNRLRGQQGDDVLNGAAGRDLLDGGPGRDRFGFVSRGDVVEARDGAPDRIGCRRQSGRVRPRALRIDRLDRVDRFCSRSSIRRGAR